MDQIKRLLNLPTDRSLFLFGARNTGKSTLVQEKFNPENSFLIDLLNSAEEDRFARDPVESIHHCFADCWQ